MRRAFVGVDDLAVPVPDLHAHELLVDHRRFDHGRDLGDRVGLTGEQAVGHDRLDEALGPNERGRARVDDRFTLADAAARDRGCEPHDHHRDQADEHELTDLLCDRPPPRRRPVDAGDGSCDRFDRRPFHHRIGIESSVTGALVASAIRRWS